MSQVDDASDIFLSPVLGGITRIVVSGFKSHRKEQSAEIRPLTILAGANSSGKSSLMQPLLLLKQTLEATYDPGAILITGPHVRFTVADQLFSKIGKDAQSILLQIGVGIGSTGVLSSEYKRVANKGISIQATRYVSSTDKAVVLRPNLTTDQIRQQIIAKHDRFQRLSTAFADDDWEWSIVRNRCFLELGLISAISDKRMPIGSFPIYEGIARAIREVIHVPGLRGNPERTYPVTAVGSTFNGTFEIYTASVIAYWHRENRPALEDLGNDLKKLGLTWKVAARSIDDTQVEIQVARLPQPTRGGAHDLVSIADVGSGVSQTLPVLVALRVAKPGQLVYLEQPEIHLHPRAQTVMAEVIADAAKRGVRVVVETHSAILILGVQTLVAEGKLSPDLVKLHWFNRQPDGSTEITSADLDDAGAFGDWPEDFADVELQAESRFLDAVEAKRG